MSDAIDWDPIRSLAYRVLKRGEPLELTSEAQALLLKSAREVAVPLQDAKDSLRSVTTARVLLEEVMRRINDGSDRLGDALIRMSRLRKVGDLDAARQQMRNILAVEVVPLYREIAEGELEKLDLLD